MKRGFMDFAATRLIPDRPGHTASWYAHEYLQLGDDSDLSDAEHKEQSLANTLSKQVKTGREQRVGRKKLNDGLYHYFPASMSPASDSNEEIVAQFSLSTQELEDIDNLVSVGKFANRNSAIKWLVIEGIKDKRTYLDKVADTISHIERLKKEVDTGE